MKHQRGITLVEVLAALTMAALIGGTIVAESLDYFRSSRIQRTVEQGHAILKALEDYQLRVESATRDPADPRGRVTNINFVDIGPDAPVSQLNAAGNFNLPTQSPYGTAFLVTAGDVGPGGSYIPPRVVVTIPVSNVSPPSVASVQVGGSTRLTFGGRPPPSARYTTRVRKIKKWAYQEDIR